MQRFVREALAAELIDVREIEPADEHLFTNWNTPDATGTS